MGIINTQFIIARHYDKEHPHIHIVYNRVSNLGKTISNKNDRYCSEKICKELTRKNDLYFAKGKDNVNVQRLKEPDKTKYEIYNTLKELLPKCKDLDENKRQEYFAVIDNPTLDKDFYQLIKEGLLQAEKDEERQRKRESYQRIKPIKKKNRGYRM